MGEPCRESIYLANVSALQDDLGTPALMPTSYVDRFIGEEAAQVCSFPEYGIMVLGHVL